MFSLFSFLATLIFAAEAAEYVVEVTRMNIITTPYTDKYLKIIESKTEFEFNWIVDVDKKTNPIKFNRQIFRTINGQSDMKEVTLENLCDEYDDKQNKDWQDMLLKRYAGVDSCPIKKGSKAVIKIQGSYPFSGDSVICGPLIAKIEMMSAENDAPIFLLAAKGNVTGSGCQ